MADTKISALPLATSIDGTEVVPIVQSGTNKIATLATVKANIISDATLLKTSSIGVTVQPYDATTLKSSAIGTTVQAYDAGTVVDALYVHTDNNYSTAEQTKLAGIADGAEVNVNADWLAVSGDAEILNKPTLGTAAAAATTDFATAAQGSKADTALQPAAIGVTVQGYDADLTSWAAIAPSAKQDTLVSGTNIKTINGSSLLGAGDLTISGGGATPGGSNGQVQFNDGGAFNGDAGLAFDKTAGKLTVGGKTVATSQPVLDLSQTWNNAGITFTGIKFNVTDEASAAGSLLLDLDVGGVSRFSVDKLGGVTINSHLQMLGSSKIYGPSFSINVGGTTAGSNGWITLASSSVVRVAINSAGVAVGNDKAIGWSSSSAASTATGLSLSRDADNILAQRNGAAAQTSRIYGTYTDVSNYRRLTSTMSTGGVAEIKPEGAGTGATGNVLYISGLPTSNPGPGILWNNAGVVNVGT